MPKKSSLLFADKKRTSFAFVVSSPLKMKITKAAVIFGVAAIAETTAGSNPLKISPGRLSLTHGANNVDDDDNNNNGFDPANVYFEYLNRCAEADLNKETCLVSNTVNAFMEMDGPPPNDDDDDGNAPTQRFLQQVDEDCDTPDVSEQDLRYIMGGARDECIGSGITISDQEFESTVDGFLQIL